MNLQGELKGLVFNIQRFSIHDGPGIRTTVFFQGCNLHCFWCHNPESNPLEPVVQYYPAKCILCYRCVELCEHHAHDSIDGMHWYNREQCTVCGRCVEECYARALVIAAKPMATSEVFDEVMKDRLYYEDSGGGVTFSGGEPLLQIEFLVELLKKHQEAGVHTAVDTAGNVPWEWLDAILPFTNLILYDVKCVDDAKHRQVTGVSNRIILKNLENLSNRSIPVWVRIPVIPGVNDNPEDMQQIASCLTGNRAIQQVELLPFHHLGSGKFESLGKEYPSKGLKPPSDEQLKSLAQVVESFGLPVHRKT